jgi:hypothetical protein
MVVSTLERLTTIWMAGEQVVVLEIREVLVLHR